MNEYAQLIGGGVLLYFGAEWFVSGASALALALRVPQILVGLTVVAYGTSAPEVVVGIEAAVAGHSDVALGTVLGSNIANIGLILGTAALVKPARVDGALRRRELPVMLLSAACVPLFLMDGLVSRWEAGSLLGAALIYTVLMVRAARSASEDAAPEVLRAPTKAVAGRFARHTKTSSAMVALAGLAVLLIGGSLFVKGAVAAAKDLGMSERLVGLTIVAVGTSVPELITCLVAARHGHSDLAVGNVVGSNIFNVLLCLGGSALVGSVGAPISSLRLELFAFLSMTAMAGAFIRTERTIRRGEGAIVLACYVLFVALTIVQGSG